MKKCSFFPSVRAGLLAGVAIAGLMGSSIGVMAQVTGSSQTTTDANGQQHESATVSVTNANKKDDKVVQSNDTKKQLRKDKKLDPVADADSKLPDKVLYDKAIDATKRGHFDVARLDLQTLLNTYPDSQVQMRAKLAIADSWYKEGGTAALTQAESEYKDFITFFPNAPEAAEAQMRVGDIYFRQMDKPDRDYAKAQHAEEEYRLMLQQFPESTLVPQAKQRLREVQEVMATREADISAFYATRNAWPATIARYQTVVDTYPQYSDMDDVLVGLGDSYEAEARYVRSLKLPEAAKARLERIYDDEAAEAYTKVVMEHSAPPHVEEARDRLEAMTLPIPTPSPEQVAASVALENSRRQYRLQDRATIMFMHRPDTVLAARDGEPSLIDPAATLAPHVTKKIVTDFNDAISPANSSRPAPASPAPTTAAANDAAPEPAQPAPAAAPGAPLQFQDVPTADANAPSGAVMTSVPGKAVASPAAGSNSMGVEILSSGSSISSQTAAKPDDTSGGLKAVGPPDATPLPAAEKANGIPEQVNDIKPGTQPAAQTANANGKKGTPRFEKNEESSSEHKKKQGV